MTFTYDAVVNTSIITGPRIAIVDASGDTVLWLDLPGRICTLGELAARLERSDFTVSGEWRAVFGDVMSLTVRVRSDRDLV